MGHSDLATTDDAALGGRLLLRQPKTGHRFGHDAILLAAATPGRTGQIAIDLGAGVGTAGLALAKRVEGLRVTLVEIDPSLTELARHNAIANGLGNRVTAETADVARLVGDDRFDVALMNPPFNDPGRMKSSPDAARRLAHVRDHDTLRVWTAVAARLLKAGATVSLIWRAEDLPAIESMLASAFGDTRIQPVAPRENADAIRVLVRATKGAAAARKLLPPLILNGPDGRPTPAAEAVLRNGDTLPLACF
jgi:tRNA1(Val) A37 N6-methylase TrmN6